MTLTAVVAACPAPMTALARAQDTVQEYNLNTRFGRNELAAEHVAPSARDEFQAHHSAWGSRVRLADVELAGLHPTGEGEVEVLVRATWYRPEQQDLRSTLLRQNWRDDRGWQLVKEERIDGDVGLLGEPVVYEVPREQAGARQFPTVRLGEGP